MNADEFASCVQNNDVASLTRLPGVGKKTAERLIIEMRDRLADWQVGEAAALPETAAPRVSADAGREAVSALIALGYRPQEASRMVQSVDSEGLNSEAIIREALKATIGTT
jgi:Holliday junction DNA helicase RuvA